MNLQRFRFTLYKSTAKFRLNAPKPHAKPYFLTSHLPFLHSGQFSRSLYSGQYPYTALKIGKIPTAHHQLSHTKPKANIQIPAITSLILLSTLLIFLSFQILFLVRILNAIHAKLRFIKKQDSRSRQSQKALSPCVNHTFHYHCFHRIDF